MVLHLLLLFIDGIKKTLKFIEALHILRETQVSCVKFRFSFIW